jgi:hypothetical protein
MKCHECSDEMECEVRTVSLEDKDGIEFDIDVAYFTCKNSDCCDYNRPTPMNQSTKKPITDLNEISVRIAVKKCE